MTADAATYPEPTDDELRRILTGARTIAVVGLSDRPEKPSFQVASYLKRVGYRIIPVNPAATKPILGEQPYPDLLSIPDEIDIVDIFRRSEYVAPVVDQAIQKGAKTVWMQLDIRDDEAAARARAAGLNVVMDRCTQIDHARLVR